MNSTEGNKMQVGLVVLVMTLGALVFVIWEGVQTRAVKESRDKEAIEQSLADNEKQKQELLNARKDLNDALAEMKAALVRMESSPPPTATPVVSSLKLPERVILEIIDNRRPNPPPIKLVPHFKDGQKK